MCMSSRASWEKGKDWIGMMRGRGFGVVLAVISCKKDWDCIDEHVGAIIVNDGCCNEEDLKVLDLSRFAELEELTIGDGCFNYVSKVSVVGLKKLKSVSIGAKSFQNESNDSELIVSECPELVSLSIGNESFKGFKEMKLNSLPSLSTLVVGSHCFNTVSFVVKDLDSLTSICLGEGCFEKSHHTVIESACVSPM